MTAVTADRFVIYTDGGASPNPGPGGWAAVVLDPAGNVVEELSGGASRTTNNRMELQAAISALDRLDAPTAVELHTDSRYLRQGVTSWVASWRARGWRRRDGGAVSNVDLWRRLEVLDRRHRVTWRWVKGHAGNRWNERADALASGEIEARGGGAAEAPVAEEALPADCVRVYLKVRCVGRNGSWLAELVTPAGTEERRGSARETTSNRLELECVLELLDGLPAGLPAAVFTGNDYIRRGATVWLDAWKRNRWRTASGAPVGNAELWRRLERQCEERQVAWPPATGEVRERLAELKERLRAR